MSIDAPMTVGAFIVGLAVGLTGMGGGALMTPALVLLFRVQPLAAVSSDLLASLVMRPLGGAIHVRRHTVHWDLVLWLCVGSVPCAFLGALLLHALGRSREVQTLVQVLLGVTLVVAAAGLVVREVAARRRRQDEGAGGPAAPVRPRRLATVAVGALGGVMVGLTSVGSGTLIVVLLLALHPTLRTRDVVGTDLVQAVPLVGSAALGHLLFGSVQLAVTTSLIIGGVSGVIVGAQISSQAQGRVIRPVLVVALAASGLKLLSVGTVALAVVLGLLAVTALGVLALSGVRGTPEAELTRAS